jgi:hypothetical protein
MFTRQETDTIKTTTITTLGLIATASAAGAIALSSIAHAHDSYLFRSPSGNIGCAIVDQGDSTYAVCKIHAHTWVTPQTGGDYCAGAGDDLLLFTGHAPSVCSQADQIWIYPSLPTLAYGQTHSVGTIICDSEPSGVTCTDTSTGHFFRVSRDSYQLG